MKGGPINFGPPFPSPEVSVCGWLGDAQNGEVSSDLRNSFRGAQRHTSDGAIVAEAILGLGRMVPGENDGYVILVGLRRTGRVDSSGKETLSRSNHRRGRRNEGRRRRRHRGAGNSVRIE